MVLDGAMGTAIQSFDLGPEDFGGPEYEGCNEYLVHTRPDVIRSIHKGHVDAGADILETNSFGSTPVVLAEYDLAHEARRPEPAIGGLGVGSRRSRLRRGQAAVRGRIDGTHHQDDICTLAA